MHQTSQRAIVSVEEIALFASHQNLPSESPFWRTDHVPLLNCLLWQVNHRPRIAPVVLLFVCLFVCSTIEHFWQVNHRPQVAPVVLPFLKNHHFEPTILKNRPCSSVPLLNCLHWQVNHRPWVSPVVLLASTRSLCDPCFSCPTHRTPQLFSQVVYHYFIRDKLMLD